MCNCFYFFFIDLFIACLPFSILSVNPSHFISGIFPIKLLFRTQLFRSIFVVTGFFQPVAILCIGIGMRFLRYKSKKDSLNLQGVARKYPFGNIQYPISNTQYSIKLLIKCWILIIPKVIFNKKAPPPVSGSGAHMFKIYC